MRRRRSEQEAWCPESRTAAGGAASGGVKDSLIFDLDGTISDPAVGILRSINHALAAFGYPQIREEQVPALIGPPIEAVTLRHSCPLARLAPVGCPPDTCATARQRGRRREVQRQ